MPEIKKLRDIVNSEGVYDWGSVTVGNRTDAIDMAGYKSATIQYSVSGVGTNVTTGIEVSNDNVGWDNADVNKEWDTITENGTETFLYSSSAKYLRFYWVGASGGAPSITNIIVYGGQG